MSAASGTQHVGLFIESGKLTLFPDVYYLVQNTQTKLTVLPIVAATGQSAFH
jgi:hypothetical protein